MSRDYVLQPYQQAGHLQIDYAKELNPQQLAAVTALPQAALVIAGAGSGKTRTLTYRVAYLIEQGVPADRILLLTFTNKAAREMMRRVADLLQSDLGGLWGGTFHSIGNRILRRHADRLGYRPDFTILDREDTKDLLKACIEDAKIDVKESLFPKPEALADIFSMALNTARSVPEVVAQDHDHFAARAAEIGAVCQHFAARKRSGNVMDFDDLLALWLRLLQEHPDICEMYQRRFQFILVDEYQDTNQLQASLIDLLAARHRNVMAVGDDSQSIYSWRGANFQNIMQFPKRYPEAGIYKIETNYRSTPEILAVANAAIAPNTRQFEKQLASSRKSGPKPVLVVCGDASEQAAFIAQRALELRDEGASLNEMAVLYRSHFHALELQLEFTRRNIPFSITSGIRFFEQAHVKDVAAYLKLACNPGDELSFKRIAGLLPGVGGRSAEKLWACFTAAQQSGDFTQPHPLARAFQACAGIAPKKTAVAWAQLTATMSQLETPPVRGDTAAMIRLVLEASYEDYLLESFANARSRLEDLEQLAVFSSRFKSAEEFLSELALLTNMDAEEEQSAADDSERIRLSSIHQAKGLEFDVVFVIMLCDGMFPSGRSLEFPDAEEEERRLFYVAVTRAKNELYLSYPLIRITAGYSGDVMQQASRFLHDIPKDLIEEWNLRH